MAARGLGKSCGRRRGVRLVQDNGPANSVEGLRLIPDGTYATEQVTFRKKDILAVETLGPFEVTISWEQLDEWL